MSNWGADSWPVAPKQGVRVSTRPVTPARRGRRLHRYDRIRTALSAATDRSCPHPPLWRTCRPPGIAIALNAGGRPLVATLPGGCAVAGVLACLPSPARCAAPAARTDRELEGPS
jgi:hypothetical protein